MFVAMSGIDISHNDRQTELVFPGDYENDPPEDVTQNALSWPGMHIDQLRQRVLSVYIGRNIISILGISRLLTTPRAVGVDSGLYTPSKSQTLLPSYSLNRR